MCLLQLIHRLTIHHLQTSTHENIAVVGDGSASSSVDLDLAESILKDCDASLTFLAGHQVSAGAISDIASNIKEYGLPGTCCRAYFPCFIFSHSYLIMNLTQVNLFNHFIS